MSLFSLNICFCIFFKNSGIRFPGGEGVGALLWRAELLFKADFSLQWGEIV